MSLTSDLSNGRAVLPAPLGSQPDIKDGDQFWTARNDELIAATRRAQHNKAQALFQKYVPRNSRSLADELSAERRVVAEKE
ncbi:MAG: hypothetical protein ABIQ90_16385 [Polaromonas sp.]